VKILFPIGTLYPSQQGGPSNTVYWMAKALTNAGIEVTIVTTNLQAEDKVPADVWLETDYGRVIYHSERSHLLPGKMLYSVWKEMPACDLVHLTSVFYPPSLLSAFVAKWHKKPVVWSPRGELDEKALVYSIWKKKPALWLIRFFLSKKITFHSTSPEETQRVRKVFGSNASVIEIPNFMELPPLVTPMASKPYLLCIGRIHPKKALENLIAALPLSEPFMQSDFTLKIAGDDRNAYGEQLKKQVAALGLNDKVEFTGLVEGDEKQRLYAGAHFSILPSHTENFGNVVIESLAQGTPVIASRGTPWEVLEVEKAGFWTENEVAALTAAIDKALHLSPDAYQIFRKNALSLARQRFDIERNVDVWITTYQNVLLLAQNGLA
jgi:glycosyltransferase involved in cell wall biosynthesis